MQTITPFLWFNGNLEEALSLYCSVFEQSKVANISRNGDAIFSAEFELNGQKLMALNISQGTQFHFNEAISLFVSVKTQAEVDDLWNKLTANGGEESRCGWLKDKFGLSWQIIPTALGELMGDPDPAKSQRVMQAMLKMNKIVIEDLQAAHAGK